MCQTVSVAEISLSNTCLKSCTAILRQVWWKFDRQFPQEMKIILPTEIHWLKRGFYKILHQCEIILMLHFLWLGRHQCIFFVQNSDFSAVPLPCRKGTQRCSAVRGGRFLRESAVQARLQCPGSIRLCSRWAQRCLAHRRCTLTQLRTSHHGACSETPTGKTGHLHETTAALVLTLWKETSYQLSVTEDDVSKCVCCSFSRKISRRLNWCWNISEQWL